MTLAEDDTEPSSDGYEYWAFTVIGGDGERLYARTVVGTDTTVETLVDGQWAESNSSWEEVQSHPDWELQSGPPDTEASMVPETEE